jgi:predicted XRE-type DNA-binding protein
VSDDPQYIKIREYVSTTLDQLMKKQNLSKIEFAHLLGTNKVHINNLFDPVANITLKSLVKAICALDKTLKITIE